MPLKIHSTTDGCIISIKVVPNSGRSAMVGLLGDALKMKIAAPPEEGRANAAVKELLARTLQIPVARIVILSGHAQARKRLLLVGLTPDNIQRQLGLV